MPDFAGFGFGSVLEGLRPLDDDRTVVINALEETLRGSLTFLPVRIPDGSPVIRYTYRILGRVGREFHLAQLDGTERRFGPHVSDIPQDVIDYALRFLPDKTLPPPDAGRLFLADDRLGTFAALFVGQSAADNVVVAAAHHPMLASDPAMGFLRSYLAKEAAKALRYN